MDYTHGQLWQWTPTGIQKMSFDALPDTQPDHPGGTSDGPTQYTDNFDPLHTIVRNSPGFENSVTSHVVLITH